MKGISRRSFLQLGGVALVAVAGGSVFRAASQGVFSAHTGPAYEPWENWRGAAAPLERIVAAGILAANPHNSQPWIFRITAMAIDLYADPRRQIGVVDPFRRELYIGLGCALENMSLAAEAEGFSVESQLMPDAGDETHAARLTFAPRAAKASELYAAIPSRHTNRAPYDTSRPIAAETMDAMRSLITGEQVRLFWLADSAAKAQFGQVALSAAEALVADEQQSLDSHAWWRQDWAEVQEHADGITLDAQGLSPFVTTLGKFLPDGSRQQNDQIFLNNLRTATLPTAAAFGILTVEDGADNVLRLECGRAWQRLHLWGTIQGLAFQPLCQICERVERERQLGSHPVMGEAVRALLGTDDWQALLPFRAGYPTQPSYPSPRRSVPQVLA